MAKRYGSVLDMVRKTADPDFAQTFESDLREHTVSRMLFVLRNRAGLLQSEMAKRMGCPQSKVSKIEHTPNANLRLGDVAAYARAAGCQVEMRFLQKATASERVKCAAREIHHHLQRLAQLADGDAKICREVSGFYHQFLFNMLLIYTTVQAALTKGRRNTPEELRQVGARLTQNTLELLESSESYLPAADDGADEPGIRVCPLADDGLEDDPAETLRKQAVPA